MNITAEILLNNNFLKRLIELALDEDLHGGDSSSEAIFGDNNIVSENISKNSTANFVAKSDGVICGLVIIPLIIEIALTKNYIKNKVSFSPLIIDGASVLKNEKIAEIKGNVGDILCLERTLLNFLSRMSGVSTLTNKMVEILDGAKAKIYDTRKTIPGHRILDKYAVNQGGGTNHRLDLSEYLMLKDNYFESNLDKVLSYLKNLDKDKNDRKLVEIEIDDFDYFKHKEIWNADIIMLDNMSLQDLEKSINLIRSKEKIFGKVYEIEISGGLSIESLDRIKSLDVDRISIGKITHSAPSFDISLDIF